MLKQLAVIFNVVLITILAQASLPQNKSGGEEFVIIINANNPTAAMKSEQISKFFLKKTIAWSHGEPVQPVDLSSDSALRQNFTKAIHGRSVSAIKAYWQRQIFSGKGVPPPEKNSRDEIVKFVKENNGAIGYVPKTDQLGKVSGIKILGVEK